MRSLQQVCVILRGCGGENAAREMMFCSRLLCRTEVMQPKKHVGLSNGLSLKKLRRIKVQKRDRCMVLLYGNFSTDGHALSLCSNCALSMLISLVQL